MRTPGRNVTAVLLLLALAAVALLLASRDRGLVPIESATGTRNARTLLPENTVLLTGADRLRQFREGEEYNYVDASWWICAEVPVGRRTVFVCDDPKQVANAKAKLDLQTLHAGTYWGWAYVRWRDSCGNSMGLQVDDRPDIVIGQDSVYNAWHWVPAGKFELPRGEHVVTLMSRERGAALAQLLFTPEKDFAPSGFITLLGSSLLRFGDDFARSPGHGSPAWDLSVGKWEIAFSLDPNRIPNQYSLVGKADGGEAVALVKEAPWQGYSGGGVPSQGYCVSFSVSPADGSSFGAVLDRSSDGRQALRVGFALNAGKTEVKADGPGVSARAEAAVSMRPDQWHRVDIERWAWVLRVAVDEQTVLLRCDLPLSGGGVGLFVDSGQAAFDDIEIVEMPWQAEDGGELTIPWAAIGEGKWYRATRTHAAEALVGKSGVMKAHLPKLGIRQLMIDELPEAKGRCVVSGLPLAGEVGSCRVFGAPDSAADLPSAATLGVAREEVRIRRAAVCYGESRTDTYSAWVYRFDQQEIADPSDYLDFTSEEYRKIKESSEVEKLRRVPKFMPVVGREADNCAWVSERGRWIVANGVLRGSGPNAAIRHAQEIVGELELSLRFRTVTPDAALEVELSGGRKPGACVFVSGTAQQPEGKLIRLDAGQAGEWHNLRIRARGDGIEAALDKQPPQRAATEPATGGRVTLRVPSGWVELDDIEFSVPRRTADGCFYAFDRRETDWWREGGQWVDHDGISCVLASSWVSLVAPEGDGMLWNKRPVGPGVVVAFNVEENTEWFGWDKEESHIHYPFDNICVSLGPEQNKDRGYRLELNAQGRKATVLYRDGKEVARADQGPSFPMRYVGGHAPYYPRKDRITVVRYGSTLTACVNAREVLRFADPEPLKVSTVGIGGYKTRINFSHVQVRDLSGLPADLP